MTSIAAAGTEPETPAPGTVRRELHFNSLQDILADAERMAAEPVTALGAWTPAQNIDHVRRLIRIAHAGTDVTMPLGLRLIARLLKSRLLGSPFKAGLKTVDAFEPPADITLEDAVSELREEIRVASEPGAMSHPSPLLGKLTHDEWVRLHCRHAELHFGHVVPAVTP